MVGQTGSDWTTVGLVTPSGHDPSCGSSIPAGQRHTPCAAFYAAARAGLVLHPRPAFLWVKLGGTTTRTADVQLLRKKFAATLEEQQLRYFSKIQ